VAQLSFNNFKKAKLLKKVLRLTFGVQVRDYG